MFWEKTLHGMFLFLRSRICELSFFQAVIQKGDVDLKCSVWQGSGVSWVCGKWLNWFGAEGVLEEA